MININQLIARNNISLQTKSYVILPNSTYI